MATKTMQRSNGTAEMAHAAEAGPQDLQARIDAEEARWAEASAQAQRQYQIEFGAHLGRMALLREMLGEAGPGQGAPVPAGEVVP